ncbi:hypothetical protein [Phaeovulum sp. W22_SRMD_FR3]|uniref:hypothetical protein n=1 Tax=Phaeovulum sp. W22_SRMD_FR3 TaxID=3240274 RepID=UPI003F97A5B3
MSARKFTNAEKIATAAKYPRLSERARRNSAKPIKKLRSRIPPPTGHQINTAVKFSVAALYHRKGPIIPLSNSRMKQINFRQSG